MLLLVRCHSARAACNVGTLAQLLLRVLLLQLRPLRGKGWQLRHGGPAAAERLVIQRHHDVVGVKAIVMSMRVAVVGVRVASREVVVRPVLVWYDPVSSAMRPCSTLRRHHSGGAGCNARATWLRPGGRRSM